MALIDLWINSRPQLEDKHIQQIIAFAGNGQLRDGNKASEELRDFLSTIPSNFLQLYADQCLRDSFNGSGFALQDLINQAGRRLGFTVELGRYRGQTGHIGYDGIWRFPDGHAVIIEVKTTDAYRIDLDTIAEYRKALIRQGSVQEQSSSMLIVVGREDTGDLEAQIRGSRHAWDMRLISVDSLMRLMVLKEEVEEPRTIRRIYDILIPREFTKLDSIVEIIFSTAEEVKHEEQPTAVEDILEEVLTAAKATPVSFNTACVERVQQALHRVFVKRSRASYASSDGALALICAVSRTYVRGDQQGFWFAFHPHQKEFLEHAQESFVVLGCGSESIVLLIPFGEFSQWLPDMNITEREDRFYWHIRIIQQDDRFMLTRKGGIERIDITRFLLLTQENI
jgi:hypothetical protein